MATIDIATAEEIDRRVEAADTARRAKRSAAAREVGELAQRRAALAEQLDDVERQLGEVLADANDVLDIDELARFTNIPPADLTEWLRARKPNRAKKKSAAGTANDRGRGPSRTRAATTSGQASAPLEPAEPRTEEAVSAPERNTVGVT